MKEKQKHLKPLETVTMFTPYIEGMFEAHIYTAIFEGDNVVKKLTIYYN